MKFKLLLWSAALAGLTLPLIAQDVSNSAQTSPSAANKAQPPAEKLSIDQVNADLVTARADNKDKRFEDAEALMLKATASRPELLYPRLELAAAQLGLKKYDEAEASFKIVLGLDPASQKLGSSGGFYGTDGTETHASRNVAGGSVVVNPESTPEVQGIAWSGLGQIYIHANKTADAKSAFDQAAKVDPKSAALYRLNETIFFFQAGSAAAQVDAANKALALDPNRARLYYFKAQGLMAQATVDPKSQKIILPPGCADAYRKYLALRPAGQFANDAKTVLAAVATTH